MAPVVGGFVVAPAVGAGTATAMVTGARAAGALSRYRIDRSTIEVSQTIPGVTTWLPRGTSSVATPRSSVVPTRPASTAVRA